MLTANPLLAFVCEGHVAVGVLMVVSGFILTHGNRDHVVDWRRFMRNRCLRILPLTLVLAVVGVYAAPTPPPLASVLQHVFLLSNLDGAAPLAPFGLMFWTIAVLLQFYLVFPFLLRIVRRGGAAWVAQAIVLALVLRAIAVAHGASARDLSYWTIAGRIDELLLGMLLGLRWVAPPGRSAPSRVASLACALGALLTATFVFHRLGGWSSDGHWKIVWPTIEGALAAWLVAAYLAAAALVPTRWSALLNGLGTLSFSLFMTHRLVLDTLVAYDVVLPMSALWNTALVALPPSLALASLTYVVVERPFLAFRGSYAEPLAAARAA